MWDLSGKKILAFEADSVEEPYATEAVLVVDGGLTLPRLGGPPRPRADRTWASSSAERIDC
jgi:hypothetical protein